MGPRTAPDVGRRVRVVTPPAGLPHLPAACLTSYPGKPSAVSSAPSSVPPGSTRVPASQS